MFQPCLIRRCALRWAIEFVNWIVAVVAVKYSLIHLILTTNHLISSDHLAIDFRWTVGDVSAWIAAARHALGQVSNVKTCGPAPCPKVGVQHVPTLRIFL